MSLIAAAAAGTLLPPWAIAVASGAVQQALHLLFTALAGPNAPLFPSTGHIHSHSAMAPTLDPAGSPLPIDLHLAVVAHVAAALLTAWLAIAANRFPSRLGLPARHPRDSSGTSRTHETGPAAHELGIADPLQAAHPQSTGSRRNAETQAVPSIIDHTSARTGPRRAPQKWSQVRPSPGDWLELT
ncbi:hypothetical protein [Sinomonas albida]|uniref:hypothetical protein n=1 Tax=Sinomonas albida TaxID=369942 RepID=UPI003017F5A6